MNIHAPLAEAAALDTTPAKIAVAFGDGIGPEIMKAALRCLSAAEAKLAVEEVDIGEQVYLSGQTSGIAPESWDTLQSAGVFFKAPITTPQGGGYKSLNVTIRKSLGLFANVRPCSAFAPFVATHHPGMDVVIVRENEEDLYAGIEHRQTNDVYQCLKLISRPGTERIIRYAFEYARANGRKKVSCFSKDNIMKLTDGLFHKVFDEVSAEYPEIEADHWIIDIGTAKLAAAPELFDVIVTSNLYGDIISDVAAEISGSVGIAPSANIGESFAMFEAIHGSAPDIAGKGIANPSGLILAGVQMLHHLGQAEAATRLHNAWLKTIEDGIHTADIYTPSQSRMKVGTGAFADALIQRMGCLPKLLKPVPFDAQAEPVTIPATTKSAPETKTLTGVDIFVQFDEPDADKLAERLLEAGHPQTLELLMITNRGVKVWPGGLPETFKTDHWRCRYHGQSAALSPKDICALFCSLADAGVDVIKTENLYSFDGIPGYSLGQGQ